MFLLLCFPRRSSFSEGFTKFMSIKLFTSRRKSPLTTGANAGFSVLEMLLVITLLGIVTAIGYAFAAHVQPDSQAAGERILSDLTRIVVTRQQQARQLNTLSRSSGTSLEEGTDNFEIAIDFATPQTTRTLLLDGVDVNHDGRDDNTGQQLSIFRDKQFIPAYTGAPLALPKGWRIALSASDMGSIPLIAGGTSARGQAARCIVFGYGGSTNPSAQNPSSPGNCGTPLQFVSGSGNTQNLARDAAPFMAVYAIAPGMDAAVALAVFTTGYTEAFHFDGHLWHGYNNRVIV